MAGAHIPPLLRSHRSFRSFWTGQTISLFGDQISLVALPLLAVLELHASAMQVGVLGAVALAPNLLFSVHLGAWADRRASRRSLMIAADLGRAALFATIPLAALLGMLSLGQLYVVAFAAGSLSVLFSIVYDVVFVSLVERERYIEATSLLHGSRAISDVGGSAAGGLLVQALTAPVAMLVDSFSFLASALFLSRARGREAAVEAEADGQLAAGARFLFRTPLLRSSLLATSTLNLFNSAFYALLILYATRTLGLDAGALGLALAIGGCGSMIGTAITGRLSSRVGLGNAVVLGFLVLPAPLLLVPLAGEISGPAFGLLAIAEFLSGIGVMVLDVGLGAMQTALVPDGMRARVSGAYRLVNYGIRPVGALLGGLLASMIGLQATMWVATAGAFGGLLWLLPSPMPQLRGLPDPAPHRP
jgi:predicted MFS family arabinose efflux permease